jgi:hypothetical protein
VVRMGVWEPSGRASSGMAKGRLFRHGVGLRAGGLCSWRAGIQLCVGLAQMGLWPGAAWGAESPEERCSGSADLRGRDLAGRLFFYCLPQSKCLECRVFGSPWCFTSVRSVSNFSAGSLGQELRRSVALSLSLSWISSLKWK